MNAKSKSNHQGRFTIQPDKDLRPCILQIIAKEMTESGNVKSINTVASELIKEGLKAKYPAIASAC